MGESISSLNLEQGQLVGGYVLESRLGGGAMGSVWRVRDGAGTEFAMKILRDSLKEDGGEDGDRDQVTARERLRREAAALSRVRHPGITSIVDMELDDAVAFIVTELVEGKNLREDVAANGRYLGDDLERLAEKLISAVKAVHAAGIIHRDIKPTNVMVSVTGPVLVDFGIAMGEGESHVTRTGLVMGTPGFIAPEVIDGAESDEMTDWWSVASVLAFAATGRPVFGTKPMMAVLERAASGHADLRGLPRRTFDAFRAALAPDRARRCTPDQLLDAIRADAMDPSISTDTMAAVPMGGGAVPLGPDAGNTGAAVAPGVPGMAAQPSPVQTAADGAGTASAAAVMSAMHAALSGDGASASAASDSAMPPAGAGVPLTAPVAGASPAVVRAVSAPLTAPVSVTPVASQTVPSRPIGATAAVPPPPVPPRPNAAAFVAAASSTPQSAAIINDSPQHPSSQEIPAARAAVPARAAAVASSSNNSENAGDAAVADMRAAIARAGGARTPDGRVPVAHAAEARVPGVGAAAPVVANGDSGADSTAAVGADGGFGSAPAADAGADSSAADRGNGVVRPFGADFSAAPGEVVDGSAGVLNRLSGAAAHMAAFHTAAPAGDAAVSVIRPHEAADGSADNPGLSPDVSDGLAGLGGGESGDVANQPSVADVVEGAAGIAGDAADATGAQVANPRVMWRASAAASTVLLPHEAAPVDRDVAFPSNGGDAYGWVPVSDDDAKDATLIGAIPHIQAPLAQDVIPTAAMSAGTAGAAAPAGVTRAMGIAPGAAAGVPVAVAGGVGTGPAGPVGAGSGAAGAGSGAAGAVGAAETMPLAPTLGPTGLENGEPYTHTTMVLPAGPGVPSDAGRRGTGAGIDSDAAVVGAPDAAEAATMAVPSSEAPTAVLGEPLVTPAAVAARRSVSSTTPAAAPRPWEDDADDTVSNAPVFDPDDDDSDDEGFVDPFGDPADPLYAQKRAQKLSSQWKEAVWIPMSLATVPIMMMSAVAPVVAAMLAAVLTWAMHVVGVASQAQLQRETRRGGMRRGGDGMLVAVGLPWYAVKALVAAIPGMLLGLLVFVLMSAASVLMPGTSTVGLPIGSSGTLSLPLPSGLPRGPVGWMLGLGGALGWIGMAFAPAAATLRMGLGRVWARRMPDGGGRLAAQIAAQRTRTARMIVVVATVVFVIATLTVLLTSGAVDWFPLSVESS